MPVAASKSLACFWYSVSSVVLEGNTATILVPLRFAGAVFAAGAVVAAAAAGAEGAAGAAVPVTPNPILSIERRLRDLIAVSSSVTAARVHGCPAAFHPSSAGLV